MRHAPICGTMPGIPSPTFPDSRIDVFAVLALDMGAAMKTLVLTLDLVGTFVFALSGATAGGVAPIRTSRTMPPELAATKDSTSTPKMSRRRRSATGVTSPSRSWPA